MKHQFAAIFILSVSFFYSQSLKEYEPIALREIKTNFTDEFIKRYNSAESLKICNEIWAEMSKQNTPFEDLTVTEKENLSYCDEFGGNPWTKKFTGCSWYCGGSIETINSSSSGATAFIHDSDYGTPWISNSAVAPNWVEYVFNPESSRITAVIIVNGNVKTNALFNEYSRARKIKMYVDDEPFGVLKLLDTNAEQVFEFPPIGPKRNENGEPIINTTWKVKFEIIETYPGRGDATALSEIYFDGDGHE